MTVDDRTASDLIRELTYKHSLVLDKTRDWDEMASLYTDDGIMDAREVGLPVFEGRDGIRNGFADLAAQTATSFHIMGNDIIEVADDGASGTCTCYFYGRGTMQDGRFLDSCGYYDDRYVATADGWKFRSRNVHFLVPLDYQVNI
jgi:ketosteroid isomerase-like protein